MPQRFSLRALGVRLILLLASLAFSLGAAEVALRLVRPQPVLLVDRGLYAPDVPAGYRLNPGFAGRISNRVEFDTRVAINRDGLRGSEIGLKRPGRMRILVLGDSFVFGVGVDEPQSYPRRLEAILRQGGIDAEVLNAGVPGYGFTEAVDWFERHGTGLAPDLILLTAFLGNDFEDALPGQTKSEVVDGALQVRGEGGSRLARALYYHSHLFLALKSSQLGAALRSALGLRAPLESRLVQRELELYRKAARSALAAQGGAAIDAAFTRLEGAADGTPIRLVLIPSPLQVDRAQWARTLAEAQADPADYDPRQPIDWFENESRWRAVPITDVSGSFAAAIRRGERIYFPIDKHLTPAGYELLAREVASSFALPAKATS